MNKPVLIYQDDMYFIEGNQEEMKRLYLVSQPVCWFQEFQLIERKELAPLQELIDKLTAKDRWF